MTQSSIVEPGAKDSREPCTICECLQGEQRVIIISTPVIELQMTHMQELNDKPSTLIGADQILLGARHGLLALLLLNTLYNVWPPQPWPDNPDKWKNTLSNAVETIKSVSHAKVKLRNSRFLSLSNL